METGEAIEIVSRRAIVAIDIHPADEELCYFFDDAAPVRRMSMCKSAGINACLAEEHVAVET
jgi:hypothetical protein